MSTKSAATKTLRTSKHGRVPGKGTVRIVEASGLRKLMRAARRGRVPEERIGLCVRAMQSANERAWVFANSKQRPVPTLPDYVPSDPPVTVDLSIHGSKPNPDPAALVGLSHA